MKLLLASLIALAFIAPAFAQDATYTHDDELALQQCIEAIRDTNNTDYTEATNQQDCIGAAAGLCQEKAENSSTQGMVDCNQREQAWWDAQLNTYYDELQSSLEPDVAESLKLAQRAWLKYRDAKCAFVDQLWRGGTVHAVMASACVMDATATRALELGDALPGQ